MMARLLPRALTSRTGLIFGQSKHLIHMRTVSLSATCPTSAAAAWHGLWGRSWSQLPAGLLAGGPAPQERPSPHPAARPARESAARSRACRPCCRCRPQRYASPTRKTGRNTQSPSSRTPMTRAAIALASSLISWAPSPQSHTGTRTGTPGPAAPTSAADAGAAGQDAVSHGAAAAKSMRSAEHAFISGWAESG